MERDQLSLALVLGLFLGLAFGHEVRTWGRNFGGFFVPEKGKIKYLFTPNIKVCLEQKKHQSL